MKNHQITRMGRRPDSCAPLRLLEKWSIACAKLALAVAKSLLCSPGYQLRRAPRGASPSLIRIFRRQKCCRSMSYGDFRLPLWIAASPDRLLGDLMAAARVSASSPPHITRFPLLLDSTNSSSFPTSPAPLTVWLLIAPTGYEPGLFPRRRHSDYHHHHHIIIINFLSTLHQLLFIT